MERNTKTKDVLEHLKNHKTITSLEAINRYGATRLSAIIFNLRQRGYEIKTFDLVEKDRNGNTVRFAEYRLVGEPT